MLLHAAPATTDVQPHEDHGLLGPGSVAWRVFSHPVAATLGFHRTVVVEMFEPYLHASVRDTGAVANRPAVRFDRTLQYVATVLFAGSEAVVRAADVLVRIHGRIRGVEPIGGQPYDANDPQLQLWIHLTQWQSVLHVFERFGPGPLSEEEDRAFWADCATTAAAQTIDPADVPRSRAEMRAYYERVRPTLAVTEEAQETVAALLDGASRLDALPPALARFRRPAAALLRRAVVATLPRHLRRMAGLGADGPFSRLVDGLTVLALRPVFAALARAPRAQAAMLQRMAPGAYPVLAPVVLGVPPRRAVVVPPEEAWRRAGVPTPRERYAARLAARADQPVVPLAPEPEGAELLPFA